MRQPSSITFSWSSLHQEKLEHYRVTEETTGTDVCGSAPNKFSSVAQLLLIILGTVEYGCT